MTSTIDSPDTTLQAPFAGQLRSIADLPAQRADSPATAAQARAVYFNTGNAFNQKQAEVPDQSFIDEPARALNRHERQSCHDGSWQADIRENPFSQIGLRCHTWPDMLKYLIRCNGNLYLRPSGMVVSDVAFCRPYQASFTVR